MVEAGTGEVKQEDVGALADRFLKACAARKVLAATAESCTGGLIIAAMTAGALARSDASIALAVTGIAGPDGGSAEKPVGLVWFGVAVDGRPVHVEKCVFDNRGRDFIRRETVKHALKLGIAALADG